MISGGQVNPYQWTKYDILKDEMTDLGVDYLNVTLGNEVGEHGYGTYFTQINDTTVYTINGNGDSINVYNLQTLSYQDLGTTIPINVDRYGCMASSATPSPRLFITGGNNASNSEDAALDDLQVLSLADMQWMSSPPSMVETRHRHGCIVANDKLWAMSGKYENSVEVINTTDIANETWQEIGTLSCMPVLMGITVVDSTIFVVGGYCRSWSTRSDTVHTIDAVTNNISTYAYSLPIAANGIPVVAIDATIYGFGGQTSGSTRLDTWYTLILLSILFILLLFCCYQKKGI